MTGDEGNDPSGPADMGEVRVKGGNVRERLASLEATVASAPYASSSSDATRSQPDEEDLRTAFARDRDRIIYSEAFFRLAGKTQVFLSPSDPLISTRMTHVIHVSQIARSIARAIGVNEDLTEAIAIGHDLGHPPFGHNGEVVLRERSEAMGLPRFMHNLHSLRVVDIVEKRGRGLNLTREVRDGIVCHNGEVHEKHLIPDVGKSETPLERYTPEITLCPPTTLEGCLMRICDRVAYAGKDLEDAIRAGLISREDMPADVVDILGNRNSRIIDTLVRDIVGNFYSDLDSFRTGNGRDPGLGEIGIRMSDEIGNAVYGLIDEFNYPRIYYSDKNRKYARQTRYIVERLFDSMMEEFTVQPRRPVELSLEDFAGTTLPRAVPVEPYKRWLRSMYARTATELDIPELHLIGTKEGINTVVKALRERGLIPDDIWEPVKEAIDSESGGGSTTLGPDLERFLFGTVQKARVRILRTMCEERTPPSSILFFLSTMSNEYLLSTSNGQSIIDYIASLTDDAAIAIFQAVTVPSNIV